MAKVIVERPRSGWRFNKRKGDQRSQRRMPPEEWLRRDRMLGKYIRTKNLNEHLGPLRRFLHSQVGRPWNKVFSEICANINRNSAVQDHVRDHVSDFVEVNVILVDGVPCFGEGRNYGRPLAERRHWPKLYVCPRTGILRRIKERKRKTQKTELETPRCVKIGPDTQCWQIDGTWFVVRLQALPMCREKSEAVDVLLDRRIRNLTADDVKNKYGSEVYAVSKRPLSKRELKQWPIPMEG